MIQWISFLTPNSRIQKAIRNMTATCDISLGSEVIVPDMYALWWVSTFFNVQWLIREPGQKYSVPPTNE